MQSNENPSDFENEELWLKYFPPRSFAVLVIGLFISSLLYRLLNLFRLGIVGMIIGFICTIAVVALTMIPIRSTEYLKGAGLSLDKYLYIKWLRKKDKCIYCRFYSEDVIDELHRKRIYDKEE